VANDLRFDAFHTGGKLLQVRQIGAGVGSENGPKTQLIKEDLVRLGIQGESMQLRTEGKQPFRQPGFFEAGMTGEQDPFIAVKVEKCHGGRQKASIEVVKKSAPGFPRRFAFFPHGLEFHFITQRVHGASESALLVSGESTFLG